MKKEKVKEIREWINIVIAFLVLVVMIIGLFQIVSLNVNLEKVTSKEITTDKITILNANGTEAASFYTENGTFIIEGKTSLMIIG